MDAAALLPAHLQARARGLICVAHSPLLELELYCLMRGLFREDFKSLVYKKPGDSIAGVCKSEMLLPTLPRLSEMRLGKGTKGGIHWGLCGSERISSTSSSLQVSNEAPVQGCILFLSA